MFVQYEIIVQMMNTYKKGYFRLLNTRSFELESESDNNVTHEHIKEWQTLGLFNNIKTAPSKVFPLHYYSFIDLIWLSLIRDMKDLNIEDSTIKKVKECLFSVIEPKNRNVKQPTVIEFYTTSIIELNSPVFMVLNDTQMFLFNDINYIEYLKSIQPENHICIPLHKQINDILDQQCYVVTNFHELLGLKSEEVQLLQMTRNECFTTLHVSLNEGKVEAIDYVERIQLPFDIEKTLQEKSCQSIEIKQQNGTIVSANRTAKQKIIL